MSESYQRHALLRVAPAAWARMIEGQPQLAKVPYVAAWSTQGWPLIVRRPTGEDDARRIPLGLPLPPANGKLRLALQFAPADIAAKVPPVTLRAIRAVAPPGWLPTVDAVLELAQRSGVEPCVYGSLLWQHLTGLTYLSATSDLDLLWPVTHPAMTHALVRDLWNVAADSAVKIDGEILLPDGAGVQWRELHAGGLDVLTKTSSVVALRPAATLFS